MKVLSQRHRIAGTTVVLALTLAACGDSSSSSSAANAQTDTGSSSSASAVSETAPPNAVNGGTMRVGSPQEPTSFLAAGITDSMTFSYAIDAFINEGLLWYRATDETGNAKSQADFWAPRLATEVPTVDNGDVKTSGCKDASAKLCVTWKLRDGVTWQDGAKFSSHDVCDTVAFFYGKYKDKNPTAILSTTGWDNITGCTEDSALQATISFKSQYGPYLSLLTGVYGVMPAKQLETAFATNADLEKTQQTVDLSLGSGNPAAYKGSDTLDKIDVGTGPYVLSAYVPTQSITLVPNKNYWDKAHPPHLDKVVIQFQADVQTQLNQTKAGDLDFGMDYRLLFLKQLQDAAKGGKIQVETIPESGAEKIDLNVCANSNGLCGADAKQSLVTADPAFRHAMIEAINRQSIVDNIAGGATTIPQDSWLYLGAEYAKSPDVQTTKYDTAKAAADLDAAGYKVDPKCSGGKGRTDKTGACISLGFVTTSGNQARADAQVAIQQDLNAVGIATNISTVKAGKLFGSFADGGVLYNHQFDLAMYTNTMSTPAEPDSYFPGYVSTQIPSKANSGQGQNDTGINDPAVDQAFTDGRSSVDLKVRAAAYQKAEKQLAVDLPEIPLYQQVTVNSYSSKLKGLKRNDLVWTYNNRDWFCDAGNCQA